MYYCDKCQILYTRPDYLKDDSRYKHCPIHHHRLWRLLVKEGRHQKEVYTLIKIKSIKGMYYDVIDLQNTNATGLLLVKEVYDI